ncbi:facilitated trehalose transporter Tret1 isoform X2 [Nasonia vitripennis]|uniref:Major facilitator superfamily (MFS) profile domain-containing protein n=1 Tax=Nasonia vitripennis TaxID=7425 RepID=A0A7M7G5D8_NASVI|nr:facilitated trehalose transporter Tret1 isoform X2 [Nasonia vitripennis]
MISQDKEDVQSNGIKMPANITGNGKTELTHPVSKLRAALPQFFAVGAKNLLLLTFGSSLGFPTILIPELQKTNPAVPVTLDEVTWIGSINLFLVPLGGFVSGPVSQRLGRRRTMMLSTVPFVVAWLIFHYAKNADMLFIAQALTGLTGGLLEAPVLTYVAEVTQPHLRGLLSATSTMAVICGVFTQMLTGSLVGWRTVALINLVYPVLCFTSLYLVPESPTWLADKGRFNEAEKALCWLRGWVSPDHVKDEFRDLREAFQKPVNVTTINSIILEANSPAKQPPKKSWQSYLERTFYLPFALVTLAFFINAFGGIMVLQVYAVIILDELKTPIDKYKATVIVGIAQVVGTIICVFIIHFTGKRKLSFFSVFSTGLSLLLISVYGYLIMHGQIDGEKYTWIPTSLMVAAAFFSHVGLKTLPWILAGEVFPPEVRSVATGSAGSIGYIFSSIANKLFLYMKYGMTLPGTFLFYASMNFVGVVGLYFMLPETEGRTLKEIEEHFAGVQRLEDRPKKANIVFKEKWAVANPQPVRDDLESRL